jgi:hypothetical protein
MKKLTTNSNRTDKKLTAKRRKSGRPIVSPTVRVVPVFRDEINVRQLGRAALRLAIELSEISITDSKAEIEPDSKANDGISSTNTAVMQTKFGNQVLDILNKNCDEDDRHETK